MYVDSGAEGALHVDSEAVSIVAEGALDVVAAAAPLPVSLKGREWCLVNWRVLRVKLRDRPLLR